MNELIEFEISSAPAGASSYEVRIAGELDLYTAPDVRQQFAGMPPETDRVVVDLRELSFVDSAGIASLLAVARDLASRGGAMTLLVRDAGILRVLEVTGLDRYFEIRVDL
ncbi:MAG: STAS domain-containing protein [Gaiellaceae bacterium]